MAGLTHTIKVRVDPKTRRALEKEAAATESSVGRIIRLAIAAHLAALPSTGRAGR